MAAARFSSDVMRTFYEPIPEEDDGPVTEEELIQALDQLYALPPKDVFALVRTDFQEWLRVWRMYISRGNENNGDLLAFARENKAKFTDLIENELKELKSVKVSFGLKVEFSIERNDETQYMEHYFREEEPHVFNRHDKELVKEEFRRDLLKERREK